MTITINLNSMWILLGVATLVICYILSYIKLTERHWATQVIWSLFWWAIVIIGLCSLDTASSAPTATRLDIGLGVLLILGGVVHLTGCIMLLDSL